MRVLAPTSHGTAVQFDPYRADYDFDEAVDGWFVDLMPSAVIFLNGAQTVSKLLKRDDIKKSLAERIIP
jgi:hypothetical protein